MSEADFLPTRFMRRDIEQEYRADGTILLRNKVPLQAMHAHIPSMLHRQASLKPTRTWLAQRDKLTRQWRRLSYADGAQAVNAVTQALLDLGPPGRVVLVLSGNSIEHGVLQLAAMQAGMPYSPITPAYSLLSRDHAKLKGMFELLDPAVVFVQNARDFEGALRALGFSESSAGAARGTRLIHVDDAIAGIGSLAWQDLLNTPVTPTVGKAVQGLSHDTVAKYLFTSGSTGSPKAVTVTQGMMCAAHAMAHQMIDSSAEAHDRVLLEWLPWSHVAGGTAIFNSVLEDGATLYLDDGRPMPGAFDETLRNLQEVQPFRLGNMPIGYTMLLQALERDEAFGRKLFSKLLRLTSMGARLPDAVYNGIQAQAIKHTGYRLPFTTAYGSTETTAAVSCVYWTTERAGLVGLPHPGVDLKLAPADDGRYEVRVRSASVTPGYLRQPQLTAQSFDEEGYYRMGDAVTFVDPAQVLEGLAFAGRLAEEFKLSSGVFVRVGSLRVDCVGALSPLVSDVVVAGADRDGVGLLAWLHVPVCCERFGMPGATAAQLAALPQLQQALRDALQAHNTSHPGSSTAIRRLLVLPEPPSMDIGEVNDKGYVNQRLVLQRRHAEVERLFARQPDEAVIVLD